MPIDWDAASVELAKPLDASAIRPPAPGKFGEYVDGLHVISEANRIFGRDGWSYTVTRLECASSEVFDLPAKGPQHRVAYVCTVRVDVGGVIREGVACGTGNGKPENIGDIIESAVKEAETDALKRALRSFGNTFGLALYEKDKARRETSDNAYDPARDVANIKAAMTGRDLLEVLKGANNENGEVIAARRAKIEQLVKGAPTISALEKMADVFKPDWDHVKDAEDLRRQELREIGEMKEIEGKSNDV